MKKGILPFELPQPMKGIVNVSEETGDIKKDLQKVADKDDAVMLAFIAPYGAVRVSPIEERIATVGFVEEWGVEFALSSICSKIDNPDKLYILINSPGGIPPSCYNISHMLRSCFPFIKAFVPQVALSGGTLMALSSNKLVMGAASRFSPFDVQVPYSESHVSAYAMGKALSRITEYFRTKTAEEAPYPWKSMADKLDPVILESWSTSLAEIGVYANELLRKSGYTDEECRKVIKALVLTENTHSFVIHRDRAKEIGLHVSDDDEDAKVLNIMREWLSGYAFESKVTHCIRYILPKTKQLKGGGNDGPRSQKGERKGKGEREKRVTNI